MKEQVSKYAEFTAYMMILRFVDNDINNIFEKSADLLQEKIEEEKPSNKEEAMDAFIDVMIDIIGDLIPYAEQFVEAEEEEQ